MDSGNGKQAPPEINSAGLSSYRIGSPAAANKTMVTCLAVGCCWVGSARLLNLSLIRSLAWLPRTRNGNVIFESTQWLIDDFRKLFENIFNKHTRVYMAGFWRHHAGAGNSALSQQLDPARQRDTGDMIHTELLCG